MNEPSFDPDHVTIERHELRTLVAVARLYLDSFTDDDRLSATEVWGYQDVQTVVTKYADQ